MNSMCFLNIPRKFWKTKNHFPIIKQIQTKGNRKKKQSYNPRKKHSGLHLVPLGGHKKNVQELTIVGFRSTKIFRGPKISASYGPAWEIAVAQIYIYSLAQGKVCYIIFYFLVYFSKDVFSNYPLGKQIQFWNKNVIQRLRILLLPRRRRCGVRCTLCTPAHGGPSYLNQLLCC